jgi:hypothetical protein
MEIPEYQMPKTALQSLEVSPQRVYKIGSKDLSTVE